MPREPRPVRLPMLRGARLVVGVATTLLLSASLVTASIPNSTTHVFSGCYSKSGGALRLIDAEAGESCKKTEVAVSWNQAGIPGIPGEPGPPGPSSLDALAGTACTQFDDSPGVVAISVAQDNSIGLSCVPGDIPDWCPANTPQVGPHMGVTCDEDTDTLTFTCDVTWYDFDRDVADGCESQLDPLPETEATVQAAADLLILGTHDLVVPANCSGSPSVACPGGVPSNPLPQVRMVGSNGVIQDNGGFTFSADVGFTTLQGIPVSAFGMDCTLNVDTGAGAFATAHVDTQVVFSSHDDPTGEPNRIDVASPTITNLEAADFTITGGFACQLADFGLAFFIDTISATLAGNISSLGGLCGAPGPELFIPCPG